MAKNSRGARAVLRRLLAVAGKSLLAMVLCCSPVLAQPLPGQMSVPDQLLQRQTGSVDNSANNPAPVQLMPAVPQFQAPLPTSRLEQIMSTRAGARLEQFGYDQLGRGRAVLVPQTGAVQDDYVLGPGDQVIISLRGQENNRFDVTVDRNGQVTIPRLPPIAASGRSFGSFREDLEAAVHRAYVATDASVSVGRVRQISVLVSGEVAQPGQQLLTGLSSAADALLLAGGVKKTGSLRNIRVQRAGHEYTVDLYSVLTPAGGGRSFRLADGDRVLVPPLSHPVAVAGMVRRPGIYEMAPRATSISASALRALAGGEEVRGRYRVTVLRIQPDGRAEMATLADGNGIVRDGEILFVQPGADDTAGQATLSGASGLAGAYPVVSGTHLSELLRAPGALGSSPYTAFGLIVRKDKLTLMRSLLAFTPAAVLAGREDQILQSDDVIRVFSANEARLLTFVVGTYLEGLAAQQNSIRNPLSQKSDSQNTLASVVTSRSGQSQALASVGEVPAEVQRSQIISLLNLAAPGSLLAQLQTEQIQRAAQQAAAASVAVNPMTGQAVPQSSVPAAPLPLAPEPDQRFSDQQQLQQQLQQSLQPQPQTGQQQPFQPNGQVGAMQGAVSDRFGPASNFAEENVAVGRFATNREVQTFGQLARQLNIDPLILVNFFVDNRVRLDGALRGPGFYFVGPNATLAEVVQAAGGTVNWADENGVELISTAIDRQTGRSATQRVTLPLHQGALASYVVRPGDQIRFSQVFTDVGVGSVTIQGQVRFAGTFPITRGEHLSELMARAGGLTNVAYPYGTVFLRQSVAQVERDGYNRAAREVQDQLVVAMTRVGNSKLDPAVFTSMQAFVSELRNTQAIGRISIMADPSALAASPAQDPLLEPGDVIYIPQRPSTISVLGQVLQPGSYPYKAGETLGEYIQRAGGYATTADESQTFVVLPDGSARKIERSWLSFHSENLPPGSAIVVPRDVTPLDLRQTIIDVSQILSQFAVAIASVAVISKQ